MTSVEPMMNDVMNDTTNGFAVIFADKVNSLYIFVWDLPRAKSDPNC